MSIAKDSITNLRLFLFEAQTELAISEKINEALQNGDLSPEQVEFWTKKSLHHLEMSQSNIRILEAFRNSYKKVDTTEFIIPLKQDNLH